jgi:hypothetical protein
MLSPASLSAFSASVLKVGLSPVQPAPVLRPFGRPPQSAAPTTTPPPMQAAPPPAGNAPRGSLLDISV